MENKEVERIKNRKPEELRARLLILLLALFILLLACGTLLHLFGDDQVEAQAISCSNSGEQLDWERWKGVDYLLQEDGSVRISRGEFYAPYLMLHLEPGPPDRNPVAISARMQIESFSGQAYTLLTAYTADRPVALVLIKTDDGRFRLGITGDANETPVSGVSSFREKSWHVLCLVLDESKGKAYGFVDDTLEVTAEWQGSSRGLQEIWIGAFWIGGSNTFGVPVNQEVAHLSIGAANPDTAAGSGDLAPPENPSGEPWLWLVLFLIFAALVAVAVIVIKYRRNRTADNRLSGGEG